MNITELHEILEKIKTVRVGLIGDFCVDIYWYADMTRSELSKETPHFPLPVTRETYAPGAAGNTAANIAALEPAALTCIGVRGDDWRGALLEDALRRKRVQASLILDAGRFTNAYCKPMRKGISDIVYEDPRLDFESMSPIDAETEERILASLEASCKGIDVLAVSDQFKYGVVTDRVRERLNRMAEDGMKIIADSRYHIGDYRHMFLKPNEFECAAALGQPVSAFEQNAKTLAERNRATVIETLGEKGSAITDGTYLRRVSAYPTTGAIDVCGAGDTTLAALTLSIGAGFNLLKCAEFAAVASAVTIRKTGETGTASPEEIQNLAFADPRERI